MNKTNNSNNELNHFILYTAPSGEVKIEIYIQNETVWLTQQKIAELFGVAKSTISEHLSNIFETGELEKEATVRKFRTVQPEGDREVARNLDYYNLDAIISVGYRVNSTKATQFCIWATKRLKEYRALMPPAASLLINGTNLLKNLLLCSKVLYLCTTNAIKAFAISCKTAFFSDRTFTKDNTPSRLTSVAHLGGLLFYKPLAI